MFPIARRNVLDWRTGQFHRKWVVDGVGLSIWIFGALMLIGIFIAYLGQAGYFTECGNRGGQIIETGAGYECFHKGTLKKLDLNT